MSSRRTTASRKVVSRLVTSTLPITDDVTGTCFCPTTDDAVVEEPDPVFDALKKAQKANQDAQQSKIDAPAAGGAGGSSNDKKEKKKGSCDCHDGQCESCNCIVAIMYCTADLCQSNWAPCTCTGFCYQANAVVYALERCLPGATRWDRVALRPTETRVNYKSTRNDCNWTTGKTAPYLTPSVVLWRVRSSAWQPSLRRPDEETCPSIIRHHHDL